jgi:hypothetical protein
MLIANLQGRAAQCDAKARATMDASYQLGKMEAYQNVAATLQDMIDGEDGDDD